MPDRTGTLERIAIELGNALVQVPARLGSSRLEETLTELGIGFPGPIPAGVVTAGNSAATAAAGIEPALRQLVAAAEAGDEANIIARGVEVIARVAQGIAGFVVLGNGLQAAGVTVPADFGERLFDLFVVDRFDAQPGVGTLLGFLGVIERVEHPGTPGDPTRPAFTERRMHWQRILDVVSDPSGHFRRIYDWDKPGFTGDKLLAGLHDLIVGLGLPALLHPASGGDPPRLEAFAFDITPVASPPGLDIDVMFPVGGNLDVPLTLPHPAWTARMKFDGQLAVGAKATLRAPFDLQIIPGGSAQVQGVAKVAIQARPAAPLILFGQSGGSRLEMAAVDAEVGVAFNWNSVAGRATVEPVLGAGVTGGRLLVDSSQGDGFLSKILSGIKIDAPFDLGFTWSLSGGLRFEGSGMLEIQIPLNLSLGPVNFIRAYLGAGFADGKVPIELSAAISAQIGPVAAAVDRLGLLATLSLPPGGGNLGPAQLDVGFKPPSGVGLAVDAGPISGGGFIGFDPALGRYSGVLALEIFGIKVSAIGLIDTRLPDGRSGYSFLIIISVEFFPIQLGFGFTLNGVGGLAGIHRTIDAEALRLGIYAGSLDSIMFPQDPVRNAPQLISDLSRIFPPAEGQFVFGPMAKIGWGTPTLVEISLGIIIELPDPIRIALLGQIAAFLPERSAAIIEIHIDFAAIIDFGAKLLSLDASLRDSRIVVWTLTGDMALRLCWGDEPNFAIALGGFHPAFAPPPGFPALRRLTLSVGAGDWIRISCQSYQAVTTNSLQFGARAELYVDVGVFVRGWIGFDALIIFSPFSFQVDFTAGLEVGVGDIRLAAVTVDGTLSGPTPWRVRGKATLSLLFFDITASFDEKFGSEDKASLPPADPWPALLGALKEPRNWSAVPAAGALAATTFQIPPDTKATLVDPAGRMTWKETVAPLDRTLTRFGSGATPSPVKFAVDRVMVGISTATFTPVTDFFAPAQFEDLSDADKLSRPSFERMQGGIEVGSSAVKAGPSIAAPLVYETEFKDREHGALLAGLFFVPLWMQQGILASGIAKQGGLVAAGDRAFAGEAKLSQKEERFVVVSTDDLSVNAAITQPTTKGAAHQALKTYLATRPGERDRLQVVPEHELEDAA